MHSSRGTTKKMIIDTVQLKPGMEGKSLDTTLKLYGGIPKKWGWGLQQLLQADWLSLQATSRQATQLMNILIKLFIFYHGSACVEKDIHLRHIQFHSWTILHIK